MEEIIRVDNVVKAFKKHTVLDGVSLTVEKGTICGLVGTNGSGKTVLLKIICGFLCPDQGSVFVNGEKIGEVRDFPEDTGVIIENPVFAGYVSGFTNLKDLASIKKKIGAEEIRETMRLVGLDPDDKKWVSKYSLGMKQRLAIAQAIMENQTVLILDEPMNGLDKQGVEDIRKLLLNMKHSGKTILLASHYPQDVEVLCDKVYELDQGHIVLK